MLTDDQRSLLDRSRIAHLATAGRDGKPHVIPLCYARDGETLYFIVDEKPKRAGTRLKRMRNIDDNPSVTFVVDVYDEDWGRLEYLLLRGEAKVVEEEGEYVRALGLLRTRYPQYRTMRLERGRNDIVRITVTGAHHWKASPSA